MADAMTPTQAIGILRVLAADEWSVGTSDRAAIRLACDALAAVERVRALHVPTPRVLDEGTYCAACGEDYPCHTIRALDGEVAP